MSPDVIGAIATGLVVVIGAFFTALTNYKLNLLKAQVADNTNRTNAVHAQTIATGAKVDALLDASVPASTPLVPVDNGPIAPTPPIA